jgi:hypothetical protein
MRISVAGALISTSPLPVPSLGISVCTLEEPCFVALQKGGDKSPQIRSGLPISVDDFAKGGFVHSKHLSQPVLPDSGLPQLQF